MRKINWTGNDDQPDSILAPYRVAVLDAARQKDEASLRLQPQPSRQLLMPELPELEVVRDVLNRRILGQTIVSAEAIPPGAAIVRCGLAGKGMQAR